MSNGLVLDQVAFKEQEKNGSQNKRFIGVNK